MIALSLIPDRTITDAEVAQCVLELIEVDEHRESRARFIPVADGLEDRPVQLVDELCRIWRSCRVLQVEACGECIIE